jgi:uncharacterized coiled-coil protein SlyX
MENVESLVIEHLRAIRSDIGIVKDDIREIKNRVTNLEQGQGMILQQLGHLSSMIASQQVSHDRLVDRMERVEKRLELQTT